MCKSGFEGSRVEVLTPSANTTSTQLRATTIDNVDYHDDDNETARRATPSIIHSQTLAWREKDLLAEMFAELAKQIPNQKSDFGRAQLPQGTCRRSRIPPLACAGNCAVNSDESKCSNIGPPSTGLFIPDHQGPLASCVANVSNSVAHS